MPGDAAPTHPAGFRWDRLAEVTPDDPLRVLLSACLPGNRTGWDGEAYPEPLAQHLARLPCVRAVPSWSRPRC